VKRAVAALCAVLVACSAALPPPGRAACYALADQRAQARVDAECPGEFAECPAAQDIIEQLQREQEACL
jgi:hypothetical protein